MIVKVCGMHDAGNIRMAEKSGVDLMGFIFYPNSPRFVKEIPEYLPDCRRVGVFVNESIPRIMEIARRMDLWAVQLHGDESPEVCRALKREGLRVIKAIGIGEGIPGNLCDYEEWCDMFLFDTACKEYGGSGRRFDWDILKDYHGSTPFLLSGGIAPDSVQKLKNFSHPRCIGIDVNSAFEISPGIKDIQKLRLFIEELNHE